MPEGVAAEPRQLAVLVVCYNRRESTLRALRSLGRVPRRVNIQIVLFDDGSTDGTSKAVLAEFPETIIVRGDGNHFWNRGLYAAWIRALELNPDAYLWLNDDVELDPDALQRLCASWDRMATASANSNFILVGSTRGSDGRLTYGGHTVERSPFALRFKLTEPSMDLQPIDTFNGNIVLVPREVVCAVGINDPLYHHNFGDTDYGLRALRAGIDIRLLEGTLGICEGNQQKSLMGYASPGLSVRERWQKVNTHHGLPFASWWRFTRRHSGRWFLLHFLIPYRRLIGLR